MLDPRPHRHSSYLSATVRMRTSFVHGGCCVTRFEAQSQHALRFAAHCSPSLPVLIRTQHMHASTHPHVPNTYPSMRSAVLGVLAIAAVMTVAAAASSSSAPQPLFASAAHATAVQAEQRHSHLLSRLRAHTLAVPEPHASSRHGSRTMSNDDDPSTRGAAASAAQALHGFYPPTFRFSITAMDKHFDIELTKNEGVVSERYQHIQSAAHTAAHSRRSSQQQIRIHASVHVSKHILSYSVSMYIARHYAQLECKTLRARVPTLRGCDCRFAWTSCIRISRRQCAYFIAQLLAHPRGMCLCNYRQT